MEVKKYLSLIKNTKKILFSNYSNFYTYCIASLYINKGTFDLYEYSKLKKFPYIFNYFFILKKFVFFIYRFLLCKTVNNSKITKSNKKNILIISNVINRNINKDIYFGNLDQQINKKKIFNCIKIYRNFSNIDGTFLWNKLKKKNNKIILSRRKNFIIETYFLYLCIKEYLRLNLLIIIGKIKIDTNYDYLISFRSLLSMIASLRLCYEIKKFILIYHPKIIIFTFEGHAWERALIKTIKQTDKNIIIVAYQFSAINKLNHSILCNFKKIYSPSIIASTGEITKKIFKKSYKKNIKCEILGSCKNRVVKIIKKKNYEILICPENLPNQLNVMLALSMKLSNYYKNIKFKLRFHPLTNPNDISNYLKILDNRPCNLIISSNSLNKDLASCSHLIYRGTATVIEALNYGVMPIYLNTYNTKFDENPLFFNKKLFFTLNKISDLENIITKKKNISKYSYDISNYFSKFNLQFFNHIKKTCR